VIDAQRGSLDKWKMHSVLKRCDIGPCHLPRTVPLTSTSLTTLLHSGSSLFIKPVQSWGGVGICQVSQTPTGYALKLHTGEAQNFRNRHQLVRAVKTYYQSLSYQDSSLPQQLIPAGDMCIVQQAAPILTWDGHAFDIRLHLQRDFTDEWIVAGWLVRVGGDQSIVSNVGISHGRVTSLEETCQALFCATASSTLEILRCKLIMVGTRIANILDEYRCFRDIGIDFGLAQNGDIWLIEVNTDDALGGPSYDLFAKLQDKAMYQEMLERKHQREAYVTFNLLDDIFSSLLSDIED